MLVLAANGICIGVVETLGQAQQLLDNWNNGIIFVVSQCDATSHETLTSNQVLDIIYNGVPLAVHTMEFGVYSETWLTVTRAVEQFL